ncbi:4-hydroxy-3-methylbut-2-en-1-yl diphosphate synthase [Candidatus Marinamargulisbacteria bacterium SCGC AG-343-D04]|nr:4-hydroxy-3-methylbut-2-en-1-yl diphosphate synthase [Candidatus Marinamargulisbacteria bacterium SCGC AG-343-D04]
MNNRKRSNTVQIDHINIGSEHPIVIQSMTNTVTKNIDETLTQIQELADAGSELVRITVNDHEAAAAVPEIITELRKRGYQTPIIGDFHYNGHILLQKYPKTAELLSKYRINPGNVGKGEKKDENFLTMLNVAKNYDKAIRIGVNWGSIDQDLFTKNMDSNASSSKPKSFNDVMIDTMVESALSSIDYAIKHGVSENKIIVSVKMSELQDMVKAYESLAQKTDIALHLGLTEAGNGVKGITSSAAALSILLQQGIGDTLRVSLTPEPGISRAREVEVCTNLLQSMNFRHFKPSITSCPGCGRTDSDYFIHLANDVNAHITQKLNEWKPRFPGVEKLKIAVMGCVVNGPGESKYANIGISLPGIRETPVAPVYIDGELSTTLKGDNITEEFIAILENYISKKYAQKTVLANQET